MYKIDPIFQFHKFTDIFEQFFCSFPITRFRYRNIINLEIFELCRILLFINNALQTLIRHLLANAVFIIRNENEFPLTAILRIQFHHSMTRRTRTGKEVEDKIGFSVYK